MAFARKVFVNTSAQILGRVLTSVLGVVTFGLLTRYLGVAGYGDYTTVFAYFGLLGIISDFGFHWVAVREISVTNGKARVDILQNLFTLRLIAAGLVVLGTLVAVAFSQYSPEVKTGIYLAAISLLWMSQVYSINAYLQSQFVMYKSVISDLLSRVATLAGVVWVLNAGYGLTAVFAVTILGFFLYYLVNLYWVHADGVLGLQWNWTVITRIFRESFWMGIVIMLSFVYFKIDTVILSLMQSSEAVGIYGAAYKIVDILLAIPAMFLGNVFPALSQSGADSDGRIGTLVGKSFDALTAIALPMAVGAIILATPIIELAAGTEFANAATIHLLGVPMTAAVTLKILMVAVLLSFWVQLFYLTNIALRAQKRLVLPYALAALINIGLNIILIPRYSYIAAAATTVIAELVVLSWTFLILKQSIRWEIQWPTLGKTALASATMGVVIYAVRDWNVLLVITIGALIYGTLSIGILRTIDPRSLLKRG